MKLTVVGFWGGYPAKNSAASAYLLQKDDFSIMLDFGSGALAKVQQYIHVTEIAAVILSHYHADHVSDIGVLQHALVVENQLANTEKTLDIYGHGENEYEFSKLTHDYTRAIRYRENEVLKLGPLFVRFLRTNHTTTCFGMRITDGNSTIVYTADSAYQDEWIKFSQGADLLVADTNFYAGQQAAAAGHMTSIDVATIAKRADVRELLLTHLPHFGDHNQLVEEAREVFPRKVMLAHEGFIWQAKKSNKG